MGDNQQEILEKPARLRRRVGTRLKATFLSGLVVLAPFGLTVYVLHAIISSADAVLLLLPAQVRPSDLLFPGAGLLLTALVVLLAGFVARNLVGAMFLSWLGRVVERIPVVASLYRMLRQIAEAFLDSGSNKGFKRVVIVEWPRKDIWCLAFVTTELGGELARSVGIAGGPLLNLFVPTTPNPTGGFHFMARSEDCRPTNLSVEDAFKMIISCGAVLPAQGLPAPGQPSRAK
jgi:uncharacterized membrane protein